jgi:hypothetical protein
MPVPSLSTLARSINDEKLHEQAEPGVWRTGPVPIPPAQSHSPRSYSSIQAINHRGLLDIDQSHNHDGGLLDNLFGCFQIQHRELHNIFLIRLSILELLRSDNLSVITVYSFEWKPAPEELRAEKDLRVVNSFIWFD